MLIPHSPRQNHLLASVLAENDEALTAHLELVPMLLGEMIYEPDTIMQHAYFPTTAVASLHYVLESGASAEVAGVGNEGMVGVSLFMGGDTTINSGMVQTAGHGYRLKGRILKEAFNRDGRMRRLLLRYTQTLVTQMFQTAACNRHHSVEQQLCRWLLLTLDRLSTNELTMTQELVAAALGFRREGVTEAAGNLQRAGYIRYRRGHITVLNRAGLEALACECYGVVRNEFVRLKQFAARDEGPRKVESEWRTSLSPSTSGDAYLSQRV
jgi:CRP-like cAMP-binding protein